MFIFLLGGSGVAISGVISPLIWVISLLITLLISSHEPPRTHQDKRIGPPGFLRLSTLPNSYSEPGCTMKAEITAVT